MVTHRWNICLAWPLSDDHAVKYQNINFTANINSVHGQLLWILTYENDYNSGIEEAELLQKSCCFLEKDSLYCDSNINSLNLFL